MKAILTIFTILAMTACGNSPAPEQIAKTFVQSVIDDNESAVAALYADGEDAPKRQWHSYAGRMRTIKQKYPDSKFSIRVVRCEELKEASKTLCLIRPTKDGVDMPTTVVVHIKDHRITNAPSMDDTIR